MTVSSGGTLAGTGTITSAITVNSGGVLEPGLPGTAGGVLTIAGTLTFASATATYVDTITGPIASLAAISGTATLGSGTVAISPYSAAQADVLYDPDRYQRRAWRCWQHVCSDRQFRAPDRCDQLHSRLRGTVTFMPADGLRVHRTE